MVKKWIGKLQVLIPAGVVFLCMVPSAYGYIVLEYHTPTPNSSPADLAFDAHGNLWFTERNANRIGKLDPSRAKSLTSEGITEFELPHPNSKPHHLVIAKNGIIWFTEGANRIGRLDPKSGDIKEYDIPTPHSDPHEIQEGPDGSIWFTEFQANKIGRLDPRSGRITEYPVGSGNPHQLIITKDKVWYTQGGIPWVNIYFNKLGSLNIKTGVVEEIRIPPEKSVPHSLTQGDDGTIWFTQLLTGKIAKLDLSGKKPKIIEYLVAKNRKPLALLVHGQYIWFTVSGPDAIGRLDLSKARPGTGRGVTYFKLPDPEGYPTRIVMDKKGRVWFTQMGRYSKGEYNHKIGLLIP